MGALHGRRPWWIVLLVLLAGRLVPAGLAEPRPTTREASSLYDRVDRDDREWIHRATVAQIDGCRIKTHDGTTLFSPDGSGHYRPLWPRDFTYMLDETLLDLRSHGINECINDGYRNVPDYVVSATSVYSVCRAP